MKLNKVQKSVPKHRILLLFIGPPEYLQSMNTIYSQNLYSAELITTYTLKNMTFQINFSKNTNICTNN